MEPMRRLNWLAMAALLSGCNGGALGSDMGLGGGDLATLPEHCSNGAQDEGETSVDCGGECSPCGAGKACKKASDCQSRVCTNSLCEMPLCTDGVHNGSETDVDCGGLCDPCAAGKACALASDCASGICSNNLCTAPACANGKRDGAESDVDCGGGECPECALGKGCNSEWDCASLLCEAGVCAAQPNCMDGMLNGAETDVDCGGGVCAKCDWGGTCVRPEDCVTGRCLGNAKCGDTNVRLTLDMAARYDWGGGFPMAVRFGDLTGDGKLDVVVLAGNPQNLIGLLYDGKGGFGTAMDAKKSFVGGAGQFFLLGDFDGDKVLDALTYDFQKFQTMQGKGDGTLVAKNSVAYQGGQRAAAGDLDADGKMDFVVASSGRSVVTVFHNTGNGMFTLQDTMMQNPFALAVVDLNRDKKPDVAVCGQTGVSVLINTGNANALLAAPVSYGGGFCQHVLGGDFDGDGRMDLVTDAGGQKLSVLPGAGDGTLGAARPAISVSLFEIAVADFNLDGRTDVALTDFQKAGASILLANPDASFQAPVLFPGGSRSAGIDAGDVDRDGRPDVVVADQNDASIYYFRNISK
jgi:hypothetical protein